VWLDAQKTIDFLKLARTERPILYIGTKQCCLVVHRFNHFSELLALFRKSVDAERHPGRHEVTIARHLVCAEQDRASVPISLKRNMVKLTSRPH
jgi:hypothetical protein